MKLGKFVEISVAVPDLAKSLPFYERLGFEKSDQSLEPWPWAVLNDGIVTLNLSQSTPGPLVLNYIAGDMRDRLNALSEAGIEATSLERGRESDLIGILESPSGIGISFLEYPARRIPRPSGLSTSKCGQFGELAVPVRDLASSMVFWTKAGFLPVRGSNLPYPWAVITDGLITVGLYETTDFDRPALVYYSDNTPERVEMLTYDGFEIGGEIPSPGGATGRTIFEPPDGQLLVFLEYRGQ